MRSLYHTVVEADLDTTDILTAELVKVTENAYRDVQIAFANEISMLCDELGIDVWKIRDLVNKVPYRDMHRPGGGVGGHCLPKDPWLLAAAASHSPFRLIPAARMVNDSMPVHVADEVAARIKEWQSRSGREDQTSIAVLGYSYLPESDDIRNTPSEQLVDELRRQGFRVKIHDPFVDGFNYAVSEAVDGCVAVIVMVPHKDYDDLELTAPIVMRVGRRA
jgi:UDP-N-acetyl-D-mannosaminuronic acid dehydrogenase